MIRRSGETEPRETDVCLIVEGCYPYVAGGVSGWIDWLMRSQSATSFRIVALWPKPDAAPARYALPPNAVGLDHLYLQDFGAGPVKRLRLPPGLDELDAALGALMSRGGREALARADAALERARRRVSLPRLFNSPVAWTLAERAYAREMPYGSFLHYFWAWRALLGGLLATLEFRLPPAKVYHTISTGYAGMLAARAAHETGRPMLLTEHGIYTNERRIELLMADWVADIVDKGHALDDPRLDLRDMWVRAFEAYARTCYETATEVITLYGDNQRAQRLLGSPSGAMRVVANGIDVDRFAAVRPAPEDARPTVALIGRVVPIKDVKTFISAVSLLRAARPDVEARIIGPLDEDPAYVAECRRLVAELGLEDTIVFTGSVNILDHLPDLHVVALTSLSESQPLVLLEAGAAGIPFVATDVGSCREIIEGRPDEAPALGSGGIVTRLASPAATSEALAHLLANPARRRHAGDVLRRRVQRHYTSAQAADAYRSIYAQHIAAPTRPRASGTA